MHSAGLIRGDGDDRRLALRRLGAPRHARPASRPASTTTTRTSATAPSATRSRPRPGVPYRELLTSPHPRADRPRADGAGDHGRHPRPDGGRLRPAARRPHAFAGRPALPGAVARDGDGRRLPRLDRRRSGGVRDAHLLGGPARDTHLGAATRLRPRVELRLRTRAQGQACSATAGRCPASPRRCSATSTPALPSAALMNGPDEHNATEVVARFVLDLHRGAEPGASG